MKVVILAGGLGTRISEESHLRPKPMIEVGGSPMLWHIMKYYSHFGHSDFIICCGYKSHVIKEYFADYYLHRSDVTFDFKNGNQMIVHSNIAEPWRVTLAYTGRNTQTGGRIKRVQNYVGNETFMMTYGDGVSNVDLHSLVKQHNDSDCIATLTAIRPGGRFGVLELDESKNHVTAFREKSVEDNNWINAGFMVLDSKVFDYIEGDSTVFERSSLEKLSKEKKLGVYKHDDFWQCMDTQRDKGVLEQLWGENRAPWKVWE
ncbi:MAG: glucose-1-phosphate cytidylyltransferase [Defluviitaleaceae bacterium]|nr:glucose-1-phosphate cytidylyltransferase [Defluviitaleaceae bacterium]